MEKEPYFLYHATSDPIDHYEGYRPLLMMGHDLYRDEMNVNPSTTNSAISRMNVATSLLFDVINYFAKIFERPRGEPIYFRFHPDRWVGFGISGECPVLVFKEDNNGTMHAFSYSYTLFATLPHDFECDWKIQSGVNTRRVHQTL